MSKHLIIRVYIDHLLIVRKSQKEINHFKKVLTSRFKITDLGQVTYYLGLCIIRDVTTGIIFLSQETYIQKILERFGMQNSKGVNTLMGK